MIPSTNGQMHVRDFADRPFLVFWETTRACKLVCRHCRAEAIDRRDPQELDSEEGQRLIESVKSFGPPEPMIIFTGGDLLMRPDIQDLVGFARGLGIRVAVSPSVTPLLDRQRMEGLVDMGVLGISVSLDGATAATHDGIRGIPGTFDSTLARIRDAVDLGMRIQVNTAVMRSNVRELADLFSLIRGLGVRIWEVFFLIRTGRGSDLEDIDPWEYEEVCHFLFDASAYGVLVRTTEAPFYRRVARQRAEGSKDAPAIGGSLHTHLRLRLLTLAGPPERSPGIQGVATGDGRGIVFVNHRGDVYPSGYLGLTAGNVRQEGLVRIYRDSPLFRSLRDPDRLGGRCGACPYRSLCGGSRARAFATFRDPLAEDPACVYQPEGAALPVSAASGIGE